MRKRRLYRVYDNSYCSPEWVSRVCREQTLSANFTKKRGTHRSSIRMQIRQKWPDHDHPNIKHSGLMTNQKVKL